MSTDIEYKPELNIHNRIVAIRKAFGLSQKEMAEVAKTSQANQSRYEKETEPTYTYLYNITRGLKLNESYVISGQPPMKGKSQITDKVSLPFYKSVKASAGGGIDFQEEDDVAFIKVPRSFVYEELYATPNELFMMRVYGDSMQPTIHHRDMIIVHKAKRRPFEGVYLVRLEESLLVKRLEERPEGIKVISDNKIYQEYMLPTNQDRLEIIGRVVWYGRML